MSPLIQNRDILTVARPSGHYNKGEVAAFVFPPDNKKLVIHRIIGKRNNAYLLKGDNILGKDGLIPEANMLGKVVRIERDEHEILFGTGSEKRTIACLSKWNILPVLLSLWGLVPSPVKQKIRGKLYGKSC